MNLDFGCIGASNIICFQREKYLIESRTSMLIIQNYLQYGFTRFHKWFRPDTVTLMNSPKIVGRSAGEAGIESGGSAVLGILCRLWHGGATGGVPRGDLSIEYNQKLGEIEIYIEERRQNDVV